MAAAREARRSGAAKAEKRRRRRQAGAAAKPATARKPQGGRRGGACGRADARPPSLACRQSSFTLPVPPSSESGRSRLPSRIVRRCRPPRSTRRSTTPSYLFEPWWPGARAFAFIERGRAAPAGRRGMADPGGHFPELMPMPGSSRRMAWCSTARCWSWMTAGPPRPRPSAMPTRGGAGQGPAAPPTWPGDLLWSGGQPVRGATFGVRRRWLEALLDARRPGHGRARLRRRRDARGRGAGGARDRWPFGAAAVRAIPRGAGRRPGCARPSRARAASRPTLALILRLPLSD